VHLTVMMPLIVSRSCNDPHDQSSPDRARSHAGEASVDRALCASQTSLFGVLTRAVQRSASGAL